MKYFAYGSNMDPKRMEKRKVNYSERKGAILRNYSLAFNKKPNRDKMGKGYANIVPADGDYVEGAIYEIEDNCLSLLDDFEGYPGHYDRTILIVESDGEIIEATTYIAQPNRVGSELKPTKAYMSHLLAGKDLLSESYYNRLLEWSTLD